jgi:bifunctional non-homologous end joining protein LigD
MMHDLLKKVPKTAMPGIVKPMLATLVDEPFDDPEWMFEVKWDGYRTISFIRNGNVFLQSRNGKNFTEKYYPVTESLSDWKFSAVVDSEIIVLNNRGISDFGKLQNWRSESDGELVMYVFDLLWYEGRNLMKLPLTDRQSILKDIFPANDDRIRLSEVFESRGTEFFRAAEKLGLEGIIAKKADSPYIPDSRSKSWLKIKVHKRQETVIGGYTVNEGTDKLFSALLLGVYEKGQLVYVGKVGTGFTEKLQREMIKMFNPLKINKSPFSTEPDVNQPSRFRPNPPRAEAVWLKPELVCEVVYSEITSDGVFRHPSFKGMRTDKKASEVVREYETDTDQVISSKKKKKARQKNSFLKLQMIIKPGEHF